ncbi:hypothetical protein Maq22A_1p33085 (plasmid) [Methylobacterium aquaticum]|uniref:Uncharacterized protein n=1 Tax=Methylobacterium aquaticum TaxID=270351 RepID=A0A0C6FZP9_9HYPH|nr:hypothetical protein Maq22A_1p33085 [Methylobacterium aquaticum]
MDRVEGLAPKRPSVWIPSAGATAAVERLARPWARLARTCSITARLSAFSMYSSFAICDEPHPFTVRCWLCHILSFTIQ